MASEKKRIEVVAAVICRDNEVFATQRGYGDYKDWWEFPGGKVEKGEMPEQALAREISEELAVEITVGDHLTTVEYDYPEFHLSMACYWCSIKAGHLTLLEHEAARWLPLHDLRQVNWLPADILVVESIENSLRRAGEAREIGLMLSVKKIGLNPGGGQ
jgi:8-oxo-dGTP diphosphatase